MNIQNSRDQRGSSFFVLGKSRNRNGDCKDGQDDVKEQVEKELTTHSKVGESVY